MDENASDLYKGDAGFYSDWPDIFICDPFFYQEWPDLLNCGIGFFLWPDIFICILATIFRQPFCKDKSVSDFIQADSIFYDRCSDKDLSVQGIPLGFNYVTTLR